MIAGPTSWIRELEQLVPSGSLNKGSQYFRTGAVRIEKGSADRVEALVTSGGTYHVGIYLEIKAQTMVASCICSFYANSKICRHIWATVLAAESKGYFRQAAEIDDLCIQTELEYEDALPDDDEFEQHGQFRRDADYDRSYKPPQPRSRNEHLARPTHPAPVWMEHLANLHSAASTGVSTRTEAKRRILYVVDAARSISVGGLIIQAVACRLKKDGGWGKPAFQETSIRNLSQLDQVDQRLLALLSGSGDIYGYHPSGAGDSCRSLHRLAPAAHEALIPMLCETGRFFIKADSVFTEAAVPLKWDCSEPWSFKIETMDDNAALRMSGFLVRDGSRIPLAEPVLLVSGLAFFREQVARFNDGNAFQWVRMLRTAGNLTIPFEQRIDFLKEIARLPFLPPMDMPNELRIDQRILQEPPELKIRPISDPWGLQQKLSGSVTFDYAGVKVQEKQETAAIYDPSSKKFFTRDHQAETDRLNRLPEVGFRPTGSWQAHRWEIAASRLAGAVRALVSEGWRVDAEGKLYRRAGNFQMNVASGVDWFELRGQADFEGHPVEMPQLLKAIARGEHTVRLGDGTYGLVPEEWLKRYRMIAAMGKASGGGLRFERHQGSLLDALLAEQPEVTFDEGFHRLRNELAGFAGVRAAASAATFNGQLREYQLEGLGWLQFLRRFRFGGCLADDMGLGKTVQVLALLDSIDRSGPCLIVAPRSVIFNWKQEAGRFTPRLRILDHTGNERMNRQQDIGNHDIVLTTYGTLRRDIPQLRGIRFDTVVLDEAQAIKNANTESAKAARLLQADHRLALTGTPVENRLADLWSLFEFLNPGLLGTASVFRAQIGRRNGNAGGQDVDPPDESLVIMSQALRPFLLRRTKENVARELPPKTEQTIYCELKPKQRELYDELRAHYRDLLLGRIDKVGIEKSRMQILEALLRLRQAACHPGLIDKERVDQPSAKLDALVPQIAELIEEGHKALVFSQFTSFLGILKKRLDQNGIVYEYLDGQTRDREARVHRFQEDGGCRLFLVSLKAGGLGLNLTAADYVFLLDPWWNPSIEAQAIDRSHRIGQVRNVFAYRLIAHDTVEEKILELQKTKRKLADAIITADNAVLANLSRENLELLLS